MGKHIDTIPAEVMEVLTARQWPGNIRELQNFIERSVILTTGNKLSFPLEKAKQAPSASQQLPLTLEDAERLHICSTLKQTNGVIGGPDGAAARLAIKRTTLYFRMQKLGISRTMDFRT
jgi:formate hydrogenlyase transcriptional activator